MLFFFFVFCLCYYFLKYLFLERGREGEREAEKHQYVLASHAPPSGDLAYNPGLCPDWGIRLLTLWFAAVAQSTEPHWPGHVCVIIFVFLYLYWTHVCQLSAVPVT